MKIYDINMHRYIDNVDEILGDYYNVLIVEIEKVEEYEKKFLIENNILFREKENKIEIIALNYRNYLVEYDVECREGIYFEKTEEYYNYYKECFYIDEMNENEKNLVISKNNMKIEILMLLYEEIIIEDKKFYQKIFIDRQFFNNKY